MQARAFELANPDVSERAHAEHDRLRALLIELVRATNDAVRDEKAIRTARTALADLASAFEVHFAGMDAAVGTAVREEHAEQYAMIRAMLDDARVGVLPTSDLTEEMAWFARSLERGMEREEQLLAATRH